MLATISKIPKVMSPEFGAAAKVLKELLEHHVQEEEDAVWSDAKKYFSPDERKAMNRKYLKLKTSVKIPA